jgi:transposase
VSYNDGKITGLKMARGRTVKVDWAESEEVLYQKYRQEKTTQRKTRLHLLWQLRQGKSLKKASEVTGVEYRTAQRWIAHYRCGGLENVLRRVPGHAAPGKAAKLRSLQQKALQAKADLGDFGSIWDAVKWVEDRWCILYSYQGMHTLLRRKHLKKKVPRRQSDQADVLRQENWKKKTSEKHLSKQD